MGYELYRHILNHAPGDLDAAARLVLAVIADDANEHTRRSYLGMDLLSHRTGLMPDAVGKALRRLAKADIEIRVPLGTDKNGKPVFALKGHRTVYLIPVFPEREFIPPKVGLQADLCDQSPAHRQTKDDAKVCLQAAKVGLQADPPPQSPHTSSSAEEDEGDDSGMLPGFGDKAPAKKTKEKKEPSWELIEARKMADGFFDKYGKFYTQSKVSVRKVIETALRNGVDRNMLAFALDAVGKQRKNVTGGTLQYALQRLHETRGHAGTDPMASRRTATECSEHHMPLPCAGCLADLRAGDDEVPRRLLAEHGPQARPDLAERLNQGEAA
ncbi:hypothetical protein ABZ249_30175 [Nocardiopsis sp. NPDC006139]|uniref:hypothetical protein n=1 Tax=Nocardiopsis sp. NPDC006139 TaxID=3154578 RepID=UPI0033ABBF53